ncbi:PH domain-containing protein [Geodermatophilus sp. SYSU D00691]
MAVPARFRLGRTAYLPVVVLLICVLPLAAAASPWGWLALLLPLAAAAYVLRAGVDIGDEGITARSAVASRTVPWSELSAVRLGERGSLWLVTTGGTEVRLPVVRIRDLPKIAELSGGRIPQPQ